MEKLQLNDYLKSHLTESTIDILLQDTFKDRSTLPSQGYRDSAQKVLQRKFNNIKKIGFLNKEMQSLGISPRINPTQYVESINAVKSTLKEKSFEVMQVKASELGYRILDIDLRSCYVSTMLGMYGEEMPYSDDAVANTGLWKFIENEFIEKKAHKD
jgi:hypothetical protein